MSTITLPEVTTFVELLRWRAAHQPNNIAYTFLVDGESEEVHCTYAQLDEQARAIAAKLQQMNVSGGRALLLYPAGLDYIAAFFGCLYAGVAAVPAYPPRRNRSLSRIESIVTDSEACVALTTNQILGNVKRRFSQEPTLQGLDWMVTEDLDTTVADTWVMPNINGDTLAFLQYTSGSTGAPKGVMVSHANLLHNEKMVQQAFQMDEESVVMGWLPLYHDMGLIGIVLQPLYNGTRCILMAPVDFLQKPVRWLQAISKYKVRVSGGPNFAYDLCIRKTTPEQRAELDLSSWRLAFNGSEPVRSETLDKFVEVFEPCGFKKESAYPCYGLAEATLFVSGEPATATPTIERLKGSALEQNKVVSANGDLRDVRELVSCGTTWLGQTIHIVNPDNFTECADSEVGEIWLAGGSVTQGYWNRPEQTNEVFNARVNGSGPSLRTGDLGFLKDGHLYVTGRLKDLIIIRGRNHYPQDIELTVEASHKALRPGCTAAFSIDVDGEERLAIVQEVKRSALRDLNVEEVTAAIRKAVSEEHELQVHTIALIKTATIPKTSSGKIRRRACKMGVLDGSLRIVGSSTLEVENREADEDSEADMDRSVLASLPTDQQRGWLAAKLQSLVAKAMKLPVAKVDMQAPLSVLGMDSLDVIEFKTDIENRLGLTVPMDEALNDLTILDLAGKIVEQFNPDAVSEESESTAKGDHDLFAKCDTDGGYFGQYRLRKDKYYTQPVLDGNPAPRMKFHGRDVIVWSINNYLGLCGDERVRSSARRTLDDFGTWTPMGSRMLTGNSWRHMELEDRLARYLQKESSIVFNFGYMGVMGTIASMVDGNDTVIIDSLSHACIVDGAWVAGQGKPFRVFRHNDMDSLEAQLKAVNKNRKGGILVVTEGVFGMSGDLAPLPEICALKNKYGARLFVDDAHGFGVMGPGGRGTGEHQGIQDQIDLYFGTFAKSFAAIGGVTAGDERVVDYIRYNARTNIFAKSLPMVYVESLFTALEIIEGEPERRDQVWHIARRLQDGLVNLGFNIGSTASPITPVYVPAGDERTATEAIRMMREDFGIFVSAVTYPVVPKGVVLFRLTSTAAHTDEDVDITLDAFRKLRDHLNISGHQGDGAVSTKVSGDLVEPTKV